MNDLRVLLAIVFSALTLHLLYGDYKIQTDIKTVDISACWKQHTII